MNNQKFPSFWKIFWVSLFLFLIGWGGLAYLVMETLPFLGPRWLFFFFLMLALSGTALPVVFFLNRRFPSEPPPDGGVLLREAMWVGVYGCALSWLQQGRVLSSGLAIVLGLGVILVEFLLRLRERSLWMPKGEAEPEP